MPRLPLALLLTGCGTLNTARPLDRGEHAIGLTLGGAVVALGDAKIPLPNAVLEGRSGLPPLAGRALDANYGLNLTGLAFGVAGAHGGASWLLIDQSHARPAVSLADRLYLYSNHLDPRKDASDRGLWAMDQIEVTASWDVGRPLLYAGLAEYLDFGEPALLLSPLAGAEIPLGQRERLSLQLEARHLAINQAKTLETVRWVTWSQAEDGGARGALSLTAGAAWRFGR